MPTSSLLSRREIDTKGGSGAGLGRYTALAHPLTTPIPHARPSVGYICGLWVLPGRAGTTARANVLTQIVPNSSSLYTLFYSVIYNSVW